MKRYTIGDIHGNINSLMQVFERSNFDYKNDLLIVLGDVVDGFSNTKEVVEELLKIKNLVFVEGNHDTWFKQFISGQHAPNLWLHQGGYNTIASYNDKVSVWKMNQGSITDDTFVDLSDTMIPVTHQDFFNRAVPYYELDNMLFVHGGFDDTKNIKEQPLSFLSWDRKIISTAKTRGIRQYDRVFIGHTDTRLIDNKHKSTDIAIYNNLLCMDTGGGWIGGRLTMTEIDSGETHQSDKVGRHDE